MVAPITSAVRLPLSPFHVLLSAGSLTGLVVASVAVFNQIRAVDRTRLIKRLGKIDPSSLAQVDEAIQAAFGLPLPEAPSTVTRAISEGTGETKTGRYEP
jgi:mRNA interferase MazF